MENDGSDAAAVMWFDGEIVLCSSVGVVELRPGKDDFGRFAGVDIGGYTELNDTPQFGLRSACMITRYTSTLDDKQKSIAFSAALPCPARLNLAALQGSPCLKQRYDISTACNASPHLHPTSISR